MADSKSAIKIIRIISISFVICVLSVVGCSKLTEPSDIVKLRQLELEKREDSLRWHGRLRELELEGELRKVLIEKGESTDDGLHFGY